MRSSSKEGRAETKGRPVGMRRTVAWMDGRDLVSAGADAGASDAGAASAGSVPISRVGEMGFNELVGNTDALVGACSPLKVR